MRVPARLRPPLKRLRNAVGLRIAGLERGAYRSGLLPIDRLTLPDFLGIGVPKAGTTWLYENLKCHPELYLAQPKELHYFESGYWQSIRTYAEHFREGDARVKGEITPNYCLLQPARIRSIKALIPDVRLILLLREPCSRAWSHAKYKVAQGMGRAVEDVAEEEYIRHLTAPDSISKGAYTRTIDNWLSAFAEEQLFVGLSEDIELRPREFLVDIFRHLGVSTKVDWGEFPYRQVVKRGFDGDIPPTLQPLIEDLYGAETERLRKHLGDRIGNWPRLARRPDR